MANTDLGKVLQIIGFLLFMVPFFVIPLSMMGGSPNFSCIPGAFVIAVIGFIFLVAGSAISGGSSIFGGSSRRQRIPPVQYPREASTRKQANDITILDCPNCGAPPRYVDANGLCMCEFCNTKYKVR